MPIEKCRSFLRMLKVFTTTQNTTLCSLHCVVDCNCAVWLLKISLFVRYGGKFDTRERPKKFRDGQETSPCSRLYKLKVVSDSTTYSTQSTPFEQFFKRLFLIIVTFVSEFSA